MNELSHWERLLPLLLRDPAPAKALFRAREDPELPLSLRERLLRVNPDGLRLAAQVVRQDRSERLLQGAPEAAAWDRRDPAAFAAAFARYHQRVPPTAIMAEDEASLWRAWRCSAA